MCLHAFIYLCLYFNFSVSSRHSNILIFLFRGNFKLTEDLKKKKKKPSTENTCMLFTQNHLLITFYPICFAPTFSISLSLSVSQSFSPSLHPGTHAHTRDCFSKQFKSKLHTSWCFIPIYFLRKCIFPKNRDTNISYLTTLFVSTSVNLAFIQYFLSNLLFVSNFVS